MEPQFLSYFVFSYYVLLILLYVPFDAGWLYFAGSDYRIQYVMDDYPENIILNVGIYMPSISLDKQKIIKKLGNTP